MQDNLLKYKKRMRPEWYEDGPVKIFTQEEIDEWVKTCDPKVWEKLAMQDGLSEEEIKWLDGIKLSQVEMTYDEIMEGNKERAPDGES